MDYESATNQQLLVIAKHDTTCPRSLLSEVVVEMLNRNLFDRIIPDVIHRVMKIEVVERIYKISFEDFMQIGRTEIWKAVERFDGTKGKNFFSFAYTVAKHEIIRQIVKIEASKRDTRNDVSYQQETEQGDEYEIFLQDRYVDVERYVVNKVTLEQLLKRVNQHQKAVLYYRLQGYTFHEISQILGRGTFSTMHQAYKFAIEKMRKGA
jgi:RNA polymerase sigma factor (sigma-70 family)